MEDGEVPENANDNCPGTASEAAGKADACQGCPNQQACATAPKGPDPGALLPSYSYSHTAFFFLLTLWFRFGFVITRYEKMIRAMYYLQNEIFV
ncbi:hypothetical protein SAY86_030876 [Trapa natans]|uniref:Uncharacterized protein n=1 Tax=Trapa natans TaxID=22666 RepID=A0AAN7MNJ4_TRANT|nr:hypothetical protein SAY86_030876 [Trapa natans]